MEIERLNIQGLTAREVAESMQRFGQNKLRFKKQNSFVELLKNLFREPMILLLIVGAVLYFVAGDRADALFMLAAIVFVAAISIYQDKRSQNALEKLKILSHPACRVIRNGKVSEIDSEELVIGDIVVVEEGTFVPADGTIVQSNDFSVNESILSGEAMHLYKDASDGNNEVFSGTIVTSGLAVVRVTAIGNGTQLGKIGKGLEDAIDEKTPLELQIENFVKKMVVAGAIVFLVVWGINYFKTFSLLDSLLKALTLAMSILPEEIPVAFTTFMALGARRLMRLGIIVKKMKTVETLGSATVICSDKTGTITENKMQLAKIYNHATGHIRKTGPALQTADMELIAAAMWASEPIPFDPMEKSIHELYAKLAPQDLRPGFTIVHEYPIGGKPPMMTHIFENAAGERIIAAKGATEALLNCSRLSEEEKSGLLAVMNEFAGEGLRVLAVGTASFWGDVFPDSQQGFLFTVKGLLGFSDPPKKNIERVLNGFYDAGLKVKIVTGDNRTTTQAIARQIGLKHFERTLSGRELMEMDNRALREKVETTAIFSRMFPEAKMRIINALKENGEVVAMTGDGVNDGPALKAAHIGVAMGKKGTEIAKQAASMIIADDDLGRMVDAVAMGRKIYTNLKKAIQYIISIHIPIIFTVFVPLALQWKYPNIFTPVHVIFLELIMGPTCSIVYENEPMEPNLMAQKPRPFGVTFFKGNELATSMVQGLWITGGALFVYQYAVKSGMDENMVRTMVFTALIAANVFLTLVNRSFYYSVSTTLRYGNALVPAVVFITVLITALLIYMDPLARFFKFERLDGQQLMLSVLVGFVSVIWFEGVKYFARHRA